MRTFVVVLIPEPIEAILLELDVLGRRSCGLGLQRSMHPLVSAVLLRFASLDALVLDPQLHPPYRQPRQSRNRPAAEGTPVVRPNSYWQPHLGKDSLKALLGSPVLGGAFGITDQQVAAKG